MQDQNQLMRDALEAFDAFGEADDVPPPSKDRWKIRSETYAGIANAMALQWGSLAAASENPPGYGE